MTGDRYRGRTTRQRNVAEKVAREWAERRAAKQASEQELDLEKASVDAEVELLDPAARADRDEGGVTAAVRPRRQATPKASDRSGSSSRGAGRRVPDLAVLPKLLHDTGAFGSLRERLGEAGIAPGQH